MSNETVNENTEVTVEVTETPDLRKVTVEEVLTLCKEMGCRLEDKKSFHGVYAPEDNRKALFIGKAKNRMTRMDISGFTPEPHDAVTILTEEAAKALKLGAVRGQIEPKKLRDESVDVLEAVRSIIKGLLDPTPGCRLKARRTKEQREADEAKRKEEVAARKANRARLKAVKERVAAEKKRREEEAKASESTEEVAAQA